MQKNLEGLGRLPRNGSPVTLDSPGKSTGKYIWDGASIHGGLMAMNRPWIRNQSFAEQRRGDRSGYLPTKKKVRAMF